MENQRFSDQKKIISDFYDEVWVVCPVCSKKGIAKTDVEKRTARLQCLSCGYNKNTTTETIIFKTKANIRTASHRFFEAELWLQYPFKEHVFFAYNGEHLSYLEQYISAVLREHKDRTGFTLLEKLPKFYHESKNREALLKIIEKLKKKN